VSVQIAGGTGGRIHLVMYWKRMRYAREAVMTLRSPQIASVGVAKAMSMNFPREGSCFKLAHRGLQTGHVDEDAG
jgi:hypothetical protein